MGALARRLVLVDHRSYVCVNLYNKMQHLPVPCSPVRPVASVVFLENPHCVTSTSRKEFIEQ